MKLKRNVISVINFVSVVSAKKKIRKILAARQFYYSVTSGTAPSQKTLEAKRGAGWKLQIMKSQASVSHCNFTALHQYSTFVRCIKEYLPCPFTDFRIPKHFSFKRERNSNKQTMHSSPQQQVCMLATVKKWYGKNFPQLFNLTPKIQSITINSSQFQT